MNSQQIFLAFNRYCQVYNFDDFWTRGNTFDALRHVYKSAETKWKGDPNVAKMNTLLRTLALDNINYLNSKINNSGIWADDFGWWGIAALSAVDYFKGQGDRQNASIYLKLARLCWDKMQRGYDKNPNIKPVPFGCANSDGTNKGTKNTVTNATLFVLSLRLFQAVKPDPAASAYLQMAYRQYTWFNGWFNLPGNDYFKIFEPPPVKGLVRERPIAPPDYEQQYLQPTWEEGWVWTGDQGLLLGGLIELLDIVASSDNTPEVPEVRETLPETGAGIIAADLKQQINYIADGIYGFLIGADNVLREAPFNSSFGYQYGKDYVCGRGVLLRYLSEHYDYFNDYFDDAVKATAEAVWNSGNTGGTNPDYQFAADWTPGNNQSFNENFTTKWGFGDAVTQWQLGTPDNKINAILQAAGLDAIGAAIRFA